MAFEGKVTRCEVGAPTVDLYVDCRVVICSWQHGTEEVRLVEGPEPRLDPPPRCVSVEVAREIARKLSSKRGS